MFFFSSRRRHTRYWRDWSSDVCSSDLDLIQPPSADHWFGTTHLGQDVFSQILDGTRSVMYVGFLAGLIATTLSVLVGVTAGYLGGKIDDTLSMLANVVLVIPAIPLMIIITSALNNARSEERRVGKECR